MGCMCLPVCLRGAKARMWNGSPQAIKAALRDGYAPSIFVEAYR